MKLQLAISAIGNERLPAGSPVNIEVRDTSLADAPAISLLYKRARVPKAGGAGAIPVQLEIAAVPDGTTVWVHIDVDRDGRVSPGDYVSAESYPVSAQPAQSLAIKVRKVT